MTEQHNDDRRWRHIDNEEPRSAELCWVSDGTNVDRLEWCTYGDIPTWEGNPLSNRTTVKWVFWRPIIDPAPPTYEERHTAWGGGNHD